MSVVPLVYVYLDNPLPTYAAHSLSMARKRYSGPIYVLTNRDGYPALAGVEVFNIQSWYSPKPFAKFASKSELDGLFRGGFWLKAVERFFVLEQFMKHFSIGAFLHAELDVLILRADDLPSILDAYGKGVFIPLQQSDRAYASLIYVNDLSALQKVLAYCISHSELGNEMKMLASHLGANPNSAHALPSETALVESVWPIAPSTVPTSNWLIDCSGFGFWVFGYDPRNVVGAVWNHFGESSSGGHFGELNLRANFSGTRVSVRTRSGELFNLRAIHVHSKVFSRLRVPGAIWFYVTVSNLGVKILIIPSLGALKSKLLGRIASRASQKVLIRTPKWIAHLFGPAVRYLVASAPRTLSQRERSVISNFLQSKPLGAIDGGGAPVVISTLAPDLIDQIMNEPELQGLPHELRTKLAGELAIFLYALQAEEPMLVTPQDEVVFEARQLRRGKKTLLFVSEKKSYDDAKHALTFWADLNLNNRWSFDAAAQVIDPAIVKQMFPGGRKDVFRWASLGINRPQPSLSAFQSYGLWVFTQQKQSVCLAKI